MVQFPASILKETRKTLKESGINTLCEASCFLVQTNGTEFSRSPIFLTPLEFKIDRVRNSLQLIKAEDAVFVNPYIEFLLQSNEINTPWTQETLVTLLIESGFDVEIDSVPCIGNFHHHRFAVLRELETLLQSSEFSPPLEALFDEASTPFQKLNLPPDLLLAADIDHLAVFDQFSQGPTVIQGPPGTGKSQVLANILGKLLAASKSSVVLSEKRVALEVLIQKLQTLGLDRLGFIVTSDAPSRSLLQQLEDNWNFFEQTSFTPEPNLRLSEQFTAQLQFSLDLLNQPDAIGGISLYDFRAWMQTIETSQSTFLGHPPAIPELQKQEATLRELYAKNLTQSVSVLDPKTLHSENFSSNFATIQQWHASLTQLNTIVPFSTWADLRFITKQAVLCQNQENHQQRQYADIYKPNSRKQKRFFKLYKEWNRWQKEMTSRSVQFKWKKEPDAAELIVLKNLFPSSNLEAKRSSFLTRKKIERQWKKYADSPVSVAQEAISELDAYRELNQFKSQLIVDFCDLGVLEPEKEVEILHHSIQSYVQSEWEILEELTPKQVSYLTESHQLLSESSSILGRLLLLDDASPILELLHDLEQDFSEIQALQSKLKDLDISFMNLIKKASNFEACQAIVANSHWSIFRQRFPAFSEFKIEDLHTKAQAIIDAQTKESKQFADAILMQVQREFNSFQTLLNTPARQLSDEGKKRKTRLRKGKSILVKEFAKTRSHPSVRELFASEAREWIQLLIPLWFSNPTQISKAFPLEQGLFDVAIFDEASQIPLQHGLGALQRSQHGIIAGDSQQMGPSSYFKSGASEIVDLLHQASFHWKSCSLKHHYRSLHPDLIAFSNKHFYKNELTAYPAFGIDQPVQHHLISNGIFDERKNEAEATAIAQKITDLINGKDTLGIVAFSEEQLRCIRAQLSAKTEQKLTERIEEGSAFLKSLENVQGDECDHLLISFGYGKDPEGNFAMRFGPMNTENGRRRLNVLLTRARKRLEFFSSVSYADFKLSDNESIDLLRLWFASIETISNSTNQIRLPIDAEITLNESTLTLKKPHVHFIHAQAFVTFQSVMESRGWSLQFD